jgi:hypothetical protein
MSTRIQKNKKPSTSTKRKKKKDIKPEPIELTIDRLHQDISSICNDIDKQDSMARLQHYFNMINVVYNIHEYNEEVLKDNTDEERISFLKNKINDLFEIVAHFDIFHTIPFLNWFKTIEIMDYDDGKYISGLEFLKKYPSVLNPMTVVDINTFKTMISENRPPNSKAHWIEDDYIKKAIMDSLNIRCILYNRYATDYLNKLKSGDIEKLTISIPETKPEQDEIKEYISKFY